MNAQLHQIGTKLFSTDALTIEISPQSEIDLSNVCRTCLQQSSGMNELISEAVFLVRSDGNLARLYEMFEASTGLKLDSNDKLPSHICDSCLQNVKNCYSFRHQSRRAHQILESVLCVMKGDNKADPPKSPEEEKEHEDETEHIESEHEEIEIDKEEEIFFELDKDLTSELNEEEIIVCEEPPIVDEDASSVPKYENDISDMEFEVLDEMSEPQEVCSENIKPQQAGRKKILNQVNLCEICGAIFELQLDLIKHFRQSHPDEKPFKCEVCQMAFVHIQSMRRHKKTHQKSAKTKFCPMCPKSFLRGDDLTRHIRTHTDTRPYACTLCEKAFKQHTELSDHMVSHLEGKTFHCEVCDKRLRSRNGWYMHMKTHKEGRDGGRKPKMKMLETE